MIPQYKFALREDLQSNKEFLPTRANDTDTGYDVRFAPEDRQPIFIKAFEYFKLPLGFRSYCPPGWYYQLHPRSSSFVKKYMHNLIGIIDESWEGSTLFAGQFIPASKSDILKIEFGEKIGQIIPIERSIVDLKEISNKEYDDLCGKRNSDRKSGGFGSTG
jgi:dUTPase